MAGLEPTGGPLRAGPGVATERTVATGVLASTCPASRTLLATAAAGGTSTQVPASASVVAAFSGDASGADCVPPSPNRSERSHVGNGAVNGSATSALSQNAIAIRTDRRVMVGRNIQERRQNDRARHSRGFL